MRFLLDEDVHVKVMVPLRAAGHDIQRVPSGVKNGEVIALAKKEQRILITRDKGFIDTLLYPPAQYGGIICLRIHPPVLEKLNQALDSLLQKIPPDKFPGKLFILEEIGFHEIS